MPAWYKKKRKRLRFKKRRGNDGVVYQLTGAKSTPQQNKPPSSGPPPGWKPPLVAPPVTEFIPGKDGKKVMPLLGLKTPYKVKDYFQLQYENYRDKQLARGDAYIYSFDEYVANNQAPTLAPSKVWNGYIKDLPQTYLWGNNTLPQNWVDELDQA